MKLRLHQWLLFSATFKIFEQANSKIIITCKLRCSKKCSSEISYHFYCASECKNLEQNEIFISISGYKISTENIKFILKWFSFFHIYQLFTFIYHLENKFAINTYLHCFWNFTPIQKPYKPQRKLTQKFLKPLPFLV